MLNHDISVRKAVELITDTATQTRKPEEKKD